MPRCYLSAKPWYFFLPHPPLKPTPPPLRTLYCFTQAAGVLHQNKRVRRVSFVRLIVCKYVKKHVHHIEINMHTESSSAFVTKWSIIYCIYQFTWILCMQLLMLYDCSIFQWLLSVSWLKVCQKHLLYWTLDAWIYWQLNKMYLCFCFQASS